MQKPRATTGPANPPGVERGDLYGSLDADTASGITQKKTDEAQAQNSALAESEGGWHRNCLPSSASIYHYFRPRGVERHLPHGCLTVLGVSAWNHIVSLSRLEIGA